MSFIYHCLLLCIVSEIEIFLPNTDFVEMLREKMPIGRLRKQFLVVNQLQNVLSKLSTRIRNILKFLFTFYSNSLFNRVVIMC